MAKLKNPKIKKNRHIGLKVTISLLAVFVVLPVGLFYGLFYDGKTKQLNVQDNLEMRNVGRDIVVDSLDDSASTHEIQIKVTDDQLDQFLYDMTETFRNQYLNKVYVQIVDNDYRFYLDARVPLFKTRVCVHTSLSDSEDHSAFLFHITDVTLGRMKGLQKLLDKEPLASYLSPQKIQDLLVDNGLNMTFDAENLTLTYPKLQLVQDLQDKTETDDYEIYLNIIRAVINDDLITIGSTNDYLYGSVDLEQFSTNDYVTDNDKQIFVDYTKVEDMCKKPLLTLLDNGIIEHDENDLGSIFHYLFSGYQAIKDNETITSAIEGLDFSCIGIEDKQLYEGFNLYDSNADLIKTMESSINPDDLASDDETKNHNLCHLTEEQVNEYLKTRSILGHTTMLHRLKPDGTSVANYITVDNFYCNLYNTDGTTSGQTADFIAKIDLNGYPTSMVFHCYVPEDGASGTKITFKIKDMFYGHNESEELKETLFAVVRSALEDTDGISVDATNYEITFDFADVVLDAKAQMEARTGLDLSSKFVGENVKINVSGEDKDANGQMTMTLIKSIRE